MEWSIVTKIKEKIGLQLYALNFGIVFENLLNTNKIDDAIQLVSTYDGFDLYFKEKLISHLGTYKYAC